MNGIETISATEIKEKYLKPPSFDEIFDFVRELGVANSQFERFYSMSPGVLRQVKGGYRNLPVKFWPIFYERIVPQYGITYLKKKVASPSVTKFVSKSIQTTNDSHDDIHDRTVSII